MNAENSNESTEAKRVLPAVLSKKERIQNLLIDCVIEIDNLSGIMPFEFVDVKELLSVMDNAVFYMEAEIRDIETLNGKWTILGK